MLPRAHRLTKRGDFARVRHHGRSRAHPLLILVVAPNGGETTRVGLVVGKRIGTAVVRNRVKRLLREAARARLSCLPAGYDIVLIARQEAAGARLGDITGALDVLLQRERLLSGRNRSGGP
ncbi:MAG TPA: ribonuclease P protein component [Chloroflexota bacterium]|nr:ribonuclease P protein component [Chloroflexota bacterium]